MRHLQLLTPYYYTYYDGHQLQLFCFQGGFRVVPRAVLALGVLAAKVSTASAVEVKLPDEDEYLHHQPVENEERDAGSGGGLGATIRRWQQTTGGVAVHADTGLSFDDTANQRIGAYSCVISSATTDEVNTHV